MQCRRREEVEDHMFGGETSLPRIPRLKISQLGIAKTAEVKELLKIFSGVDKPFLLFTTTPQNAYRTARPLVEHLYSHL
jgi:hypothetical protein